MIPKIIHYSWLSDDPMPEAFERYLESWKRVMPDFEIRRWDFTRFPREKSAWVAEAFDNRKYAFAADFLRNYALYSEGGVYLDADVEALKSLDCLLHLPYCLCFENGSGCIEAGVMMSEPGNPIFGRMLEYYRDRHFVKPDGTLDTLPLPVVMSRVLADYKVKPIASPAEFDASAGVISVLPFYYFSPIHLETRELQLHPDTLVIHRFAGSWQSKSLKFKKWVKGIVGPRFTAWFIRTKARVLGRRK